LLNKIAIVGSAGKVGTVLMAHFGDRAVGVPAPTDEDRLTGIFAGVETVIWSAARPWPHHDLGPRVNDTRDFLDVVKACEVASVSRLVFTSSFNVEHDLYGVGVAHYPKGTADNYYTASKKAGEAFTRAYAVSNGRIGVCIRLGYFNPEAPVYLPIEKVRLHEEGIKGWYEKAVKETSQFSVWSATNWG
jgi:nucleoside-diphosphate-sugar epimerase